MAKKAPAAPAAKPTKKAAVPKKQAKQSDKKAPAVPAKKMSMKEKMAELRKMKKK